MITAGLVILVCGILVGSAPLAWIGLIISVIGLSLLLLGVAAHLGRGDWW